MIINLFLLAVCIIVFSVIRKQIKKKYSFGPVKEVQAAIIIPMLQLLLFTTFIYGKGEDVIKSANLIDRLHNVSTYTPHLGSLGEIVNLANQYGLLPDVERSQSTIDFINLAGITNNITNWGLLIVIVLVLLELYGALYFDKFTEKQMQMFFGGVFVVYLASTVSVVLCFEKLMEMMSVEPSVNIMFKTPIIHTVIIAVSYRYYQKAISRLLIW